MPSNIRDIILAVLVAFGGTAVLLAIARHVDVCRWLAARLLALAEMRGHWRDSVGRAEKKVMPAEKRPVVLDANEERWYG